MRTLLVLCGAHAAAMVNAYPGARTIARGEYAECEHTSHAAWAGGTDAPATHKVAIQDGAQ